MKIKYKIASVIILLLLFAWGVIYLSGLSVVKNTSYSFHSVILKRIEQIGYLELVKFSVNDVAEETVSRTLFNIDNLAPDSKVLFIINGEATASIDLEQVKKEDITFTNNRVTVTLPQPFISYAKVNHNSSRVYDVNLTARLFNPELIDKGFRNAENRIKQEALKGGIIQQARENAVKVLTPIFEEISSRKVDVKFR